MSGTVDLQKLQKFLNKQTHGYPGSLLLVYAVLDGQERLVARCIGTIDLLF